MSSNDVLSSEQALDDYFNALLGDDAEATTLEEELDLLAQEISSAEPEPEPEPAPNSRPLLSTRVQCRAEP